MKKEIKREIPKSKRSFRHSGLCRCVPVRRTGHSPQRGRADRRGGPGGRLSAQPTVQRHQCPAHRRRRRHVDQLLRCRPDPPRHAAGVSGFSAFGRAGNGCSGNSAADCYNETSGRANLTDDLVAEFLRDSDFGVSERRRNGKSVFAARPMFFAIPPVPCHDPLRRTPSNSA